MWHHVARKIVTNITEEYVASIFMVEEVIVFLDVMPYSPEDRY